MKKLFLLFSLFSLIFSLSEALAYTQVDVDNANYLAGKNIITAQSKTAGYRLDDTITRAEVAGIALKLRGTILPEGYICKKYFSDTIKNDWICRAVELAADAGIVSRTNTKFRSQDKITRAEALSILEKAGNVSIVTYESGLGNSDFENAIREPWQRNVFWTAKKFMTMRVDEYKPNNNATRAEVFTFAKKILEYKATMSGEVSI